MRAGVHEEQMVFVNVLASPQGLDRITKAHPKLSIVTSSIERALNDQAYMLPGIGDFGDRYFGTTQRH